MLINHSFNSNLIEFIFSSIYALHACKQNKPQAQSVLLQRQLIKIQNNALHSASFLQAKTQDKPKMYSRL